MISAAQRSTSRFGAAAFLAGACCLASCGGGAPTELPNVLLVTLDTTRADRLSCYGYARETSPNLDRLAAAGTLFERCLAQASVTPVSHASILTGQRPYRHGLRYLHGSQGSKLADGALTLAEILAEHGADTGAFVSAFPAGSRFGLAQGFATFDEAFGAGARPAVSAEGVVNTGASQRTAEATNAAAFRWLDSRGDRPFFLWVHYFDPHDAGLLPADPADRRRFRTPDGSPMQRYLDWYDSEVAYMDRHLGALVERARRGPRPLIVAVLADHGQGLGDHDWWSHGMLWREQIRVPFVLAGAGVPAGRRVTQLVRTVDVMPTLLALVGLDPGREAGEIDGIDLTPAFTAEGETALHLTAYSESTTMGMTYAVPFDAAAGDQKTGQLFSLVQGRWKYVHNRHAEGADQLFDLQEDTGETKNLIRDEPEIARRLRAALLALDPYPAAGTGTGDLPAEELERLRELGYLSRPPAPPVETGGKDGDGRQ